MRLEVPKGFPFKRSRNSPQIKAPKKFSSQAAQAKTVRKVNGMVIMVPSRRAKKKTGRSKK
jgi:hypothetical protein